MNNPAKVFDIAIVGGGMVGLTLALLFAQKSKWRIALIESHPLQRQEPIALPNSFDARSTALAEGSRAILEQCGVWQPLADKLTAIEQVHVSDRGHFAGNLLHAADFGRQALGYVVENPRFGQALLQVLETREGIEVFAPERVLSTDRMESGWRLGLQHHHVDCQLLVLADGANSDLGKRLGIRHRIEDYGQQAIIANVETDSAHRGVAYERFTKKGPIALLPLGFTSQSRLSALVWTRPKHAAEDLMNLSDEAFCRQLQAEFGHRGGRFCRVSRRFSYPLQLAVATEQVRSGLVLMGNAAHFLHPVAGQGFNLALRDCQHLVETLNGADNPGDLRVLQIYLAGQQQDQTATIGLSHNLVKLFSTDALPSALLRSLGLIGLDAIGPAKRLFSQQAMGFPLVGNGAR